MPEFVPNEKISYNNEIYTVIALDGDALSVKRVGSHTPISIPKNEAKKVFQEGRSVFDPNKRLNG